MSGILICIICLFTFFIGVPIVTLLFRFFASPKKGKNKYFKDQYGRLLFYRGVNVCNSSKWEMGNLPWHTKEDYMKLKEHGFNLVRFLIYWEAIEPTKGTYNTTYISKVKEHIQILNELGIQVLIDIHQDLYNKKFTGNGFPDWTLPEKEYPFKPQKDWYMNYLQKAVRESYNNFWKRGDLKSCYIKMLDFVESQFRSEPNVIGIDVMNEPFPTLPLLFSFERGTLSDFYEHITLHSEDQKYKVPLFFEPGIWTSSGIPTDLTEALKISYIPHHYPPFAHHKGNFNWFNRLLMTLTIRSKAREAQKATSPYIMGEFGMAVAVKNRLKGIKHFMQLADRYHMSWVWWSYDKEENSAQGMLDNKGNPNDVMETLTRAYPQKIAGSDPVFRNDGNKFFLEYTADVIYLAPTEIYIPGKMRYINSDMELSAKSEHVYEFTSNKLGKHKIEVAWQYTQQEIPTET